MVLPRKKPLYHPVSPAVEQAAQLLLCLGKTGEEMGLTQLCRQIHIHKSKGFSILNALIHYDLVTKNNRTKTYSLGPALMPLGQTAREKLDITAIAQNPLQDLAHETRSSVLLGIICNDQFYIAGKYEGSDTLSVTARQFHSLHITHGSHGKAIFAFLPESEQQRLLEGGQVFFHGEAAAFDPKRLEQELSLVRQNGYAMDNGELTPGMLAVSAPIFDHNHEVFAGIVVLGTFTPDKFEPFGQKAASAGRLISRQLGAQV